MNITPQQVKEAQTPYFMEQINGLVAHWKANDDKFMELVLKGADATAAYLRKYAVDRELDDIQVELFVIIMMDNIAGALKVMQTIRQISEIAGPDVAQAMLKAGSRQEDRQRAQAVSTSCNCAVCQGVEQQTPDLN
jgi:hypothetical protein